MTSKPHTPPDRLYTRLGVWLNLFPDQVLIGLSEYVVRELGEVSHVEYRVDKGLVKKDQELCLVEASKAVIPVPCPSDGVILCTNQKAAQYPLLVSQTPNQTWLVSMVPDTPFSPGLDLLSERQFIKWLDHHRESAADTGITQTKIEVISSEDFVNHLKALRATNPRVIIRITDNTCCGVSALILDDRYKRATDVLAGYIEAVPIYVSSTLSMDLQRLVRIRVEARKSLFGVYYHFIFLS